MSGMCRGFLVDEVGLHVDEETQMFNDEVSFILNMPSKVEENLPETNEGYGTKEYWYMTA
jgi:hypothetical protein